MPQILRWTPLLATISGLVVVVGCKSKKGGDSAVTATGADCAKPSSEAGEAQSHPLGTQITLNGTGSSWCESYRAHEITYTWDFETVPPDSDVAETSLSDNRTSTAADPDFLPDTPGEYVLSLRINDPNNASDPDYVVINISTDDLPPTADCGADTAGMVGLATTMDGSESTDPEGAAITYQWAVSSRPECSGLRSDDLFDQGTVSPSVIPDCAGLFVVSLVVSDGLQWSDPSYCTIEVAADNHVPIADAGESAELPPCANNPFQLSGWGSYDRDGQPLTYAWTVVGTPASANPELYAFNDATLAAPWFTWDAVGIWSFQLQVSDGIDISAPDIVSYTVTDSTNNNSPTANAGADQTVEVSGGCSSDAYVWTCEDCPETRVELDGSASSDPDGDTMQYTWSEQYDPLETTAELTFTNPSAALSDAIIPARPAEFGVNNTKVYQVELAVTDCTMGDEDVMEIFYSCTGINEPEDEE